MPTEITGRLIELTMKPHCMEGILGIQSTRKIRYGNDFEDRPYTIYVRFITDDKDVIDVVRKSDGNITLSGHFANTNGDLVFCAEQAKEI